MTGTFEDDSSEEELDMLESKAKAALKVLGRNVTRGQNYFKPQRWNLSKC